MSESEIRLIQTDIRTDLEAAMKLSISRDSQIAVYLARVFVNVMRESSMRLADSVGPNHLRLQDKK